MADIIPIFEKLFLASGVTVTKDDWFDISGAIPAGKQLWLGFATFIAEDKGLIFELRPNLPGENLGTVAKTQLKGFSSPAGGESRDLDLYFGGAIQSVAPVTAQSTGVEKLWLRVRSGSLAAGAWDYIIYYTIY